MKAQFSIRITQEAADRQAVREAIDINAQCADRRAANGQKALFTQDSHFVVVRGRQESEALHGATFARSARAFTRESRLVDCDPLKFLRLGIQSARLRANAAHRAFGPENGAAPGVGRPRLNCSMARWNTARHPA